MVAYKWHLVFTPEAQEDLERLSSPDRLLVSAKLIDLLNADDPTDQQQVTDIKP